MPFLLVGLVVGKKLFKKINLVWVNRGVYLIVFVAGVSFLIS